MSAATVFDDATARRCEGTPTLTVIDNRGLVVRTVQYNRTAIDDPLDELITRQSWSARGYLMTRIDPRLFDEQRLDPDVPPNFRYVRSLSGQPLTIASQDAGEQTALYDSDGGVVWQHDSRDQQLRRTYDTLHRLVSVTEQTGPATPRISERLLYGDATAADNANLRGQLRQAWSPAGMAETPSYSLAGQPLATVQQFLRDDVLDSDWASDDPARWTNALAPDTYTTRWAYNALGQELERTDARGNRQRQHYNVAGQLAGSDLQLAGQSTWQPLLRAISYSAAGQVLREEAGNGVVTDYTYEPQTQRLAELHTTRPPQAGRTTLLQALSYQYDPVGNLLAIDDAAKATRHTRNQRVAPASHYSYDALYQLTRATGRENANAGRQSQALPAPIVPLFQEIGELTPYTRTYRYDRGANLTTLQHQGTRSSYTQQMVVARTSNRAVPQTDGLTPGDVASYFDACGNLKALGASQPLAWDSRNQLQRTTQVVRRGLDDDTEVYWYDGAGQRATKLGTARTSGTTRTERVRYLPGLELRQIEQTRTGETLPTPVERLQVLTLGAAGRQSVRLLHWELGQPSTIENDQLRVSLDDQIGSSMLELDAQADILTWEEYYPFGGTSVWSARSDTEAKYKYVRYSGQERDATGLYYYGFRYYAPWLGRWLNPDPAGPVDGLNLFCMVANNPIVLLDPEGLTRTTSSKLTTERREHYSGFLNMANIVTSCLRPHQQTDAFQIDADRITEDHMKPMRSHVIQKLHYNKKILKFLQKNTADTLGALGELESRISESEKSVKSINYPFNKETIALDAQILLENNSKEIAIFGEISALATSYLTAIEEFSGAAIRMATEIVDDVVSMRLGGIEDAMCKRVNAIKTAKSSRVEFIEDTMRVRNKTDSALVEGEHEETISKFLSNKSNIHVKSGDAQSGVDRQMKNQPPKDLHKRLGRAGSRFARAWGDLRRFL
ncbi:RHS repeat-associated core domain-containing protein [Burkholderia sp. S-53]|uniref:RHS repeat-associated core domain-containing protein n=1 Tax=Burkholderia sp. S-53 TaxID=2906514 RepID=UPI0021D17AD0|nr:RHS repeat-associated core domain-containing protein [Burkholderia sp. S-53]UXU85254.1 RHS repeat protein [Burkholderia sp. S-53]